MTVTIRPMAVTDLDTVQMLEQQLFGAGCWSRRTLEEERIGPGRSYIVGEMDGQVIAYAGLWFDGEITQIMTVATASAAQSRGVGRQLLRSLVDESRKLGAHTVFLDVRVDNDPAVHLYRSEGFEQVAVRRRYYQPENVDGLMMRLVLTPSG